MQKLGRLCSVRANFAAHKVLLYKTGHSCIVKNLCAGQVSLNVATSNDHGGTENVAECLPNRAKISP